MKHPTKLLVLAASLTAAFSLQAQTLLSDFSSGTNWGTSTTLVGTTGTLAVSSGVGNYYNNAAPAGDEFAYMKFNGVTLSYNTSWSIRVDVNYAAPGTIFTSGSQQFINLGLMVTPSSETIDLNGQNPGFVGFLVSSNLFSTTTNTYNRGFQTSIFADGSSTDGTEGGYLNNITGATFTAVTLSYNAGSHTLTASYDGNTTNGYNYFSLPSQSVDVNTWGMSSTHTFSLYLFGNSGWDDAGPNVSPSIALGEAKFDNLTAVPEPSTYATIAGALALGTAVWRRRQRGAGN